jgi:hypothetical protein
VLHVRVVVPADEDVQGRIAEARGEDVLFKRSDIASGGTEGRLAGGDAGHGDAGADEVHLELEAGVRGYEDGVELLHERGDEVIAGDVDAAVGQDVLGVLRR